MIKTFAGEVYYDTSLGIPYFEEILGKAPPIDYMRQKFTDAAKVVPGVVEVRCFIASIKNRVVTGQVQIADKTGVLSAANF